MTTPGAGARPAGPEPANLAAPPLLDAAVLLPACGGSDAFLERICGALAKMLPTELDDATRALDEGSAVALQHVAHQLSGVLAAFSTRAATVAAELEQAAARHQLDEARRLLGQLRQMSPQLLREVGVVTVEVLARSAG